MKIGFFDSGIGGLAVLNRALTILPNEDYIYYADVDHVPYGTKTKEQIIKFADNAVQFLTAHDVKAIVVACNTATSVAIGYLREKYRIPILGMEPAVKPAVEHKGGGRVLVIATPLTTREAKLKNLICAVDTENKVDIHPISGLVTFAENGEFDSPAVEAYLKKELEGYNLSDYSELVLGCTHFNYFKDTYAKIFPPGTEFIEGSAGTVKHLRNILSERNLLENNGGNVEYYYSGKRIKDGEEKQKIDKLLLRLDKMRNIDRCI